jgi:hypothetical protein
MARSYPSRTGGFVYFFQAGPGGAIKIGASERPSVRFAEIQTSMPFDLIPMLLLRGSENEQALHERFRYLRIRGEWYRAHDDLLLFIIEAIRKSDARQRIAGQVVRIADMPALPKRSHELDPLSDEDAKVIDRGFQAAVDLLERFPDKWERTAKERPPMQRFRRR